MYGAFGRPIIKRNETNGFGRFFAPSVSPFSSSFGFHYLLCIVYLMAVADEIRAVIWPEKSEYLDYCHRQIILN